MADKIKLRRDTQANWEAVNPILDQGELGWITDRNTGKLGDGIHGFNDLQSLHGVPEDWVNVKDFGAKGDGVHDDTQAIQTALDTGKTVFIPEGIFIVHDLLWNKQNNIYGIGINSILKNSTPGSTTLIEYDPGIWDFKKIVSLQLIGNLELNNNGIGFFNYISGRIIIDNVHFENFDKAVYKQTGNIGNRLYNCTFEKCNFHWYTQSSSAPEIMHAGCSYFNGCHFRNANLASIYINNSEHSGQITFEDCIFEGNPGFVIFIKDYGFNHQNWINFRTPWFELNSSSPNVVIDGIEYQPVPIFANNTSQFYIFNTELPSISLTNSILQTNFCGFFNNYDATLVNSIIQNTSASVYRSVDKFLIDSVASYQPLYHIQAIFMPPRFNTIKGLLNNLKFSQHFYGTTPITIPGSTTSYISSQVADGVNSTNCSEFVINNGNNAVISMPALTLANQYLLIANFKVISGSVNFQLQAPVNSNIRGSLNTIENFNNRWVSFAMFGYVNATTTNELIISDRTGVSSTLRLDEIQLFEFNTQEELLKILNSGNSSEN